MGRLSALGLVLAIAGGLAMAWFGAAYGRVLASVGDGAPTVWIWLLLAGVPTAIGAAPLAVALWLGWRLWTERRAGWVAQGLAGAAVPALAGAVALSWSPDVFGEPMGVFVGGALAAMAGFVLCLIGLWRGAASDA